ncbi:hypothetical protein Cme02nite_32710 [Catellatospora methionotrophica]|uniref:Uncharacterized protein n=1 Tax=Catellatospora methionotrophica TaxID=121620 RepID=A0A8J3LAT4_9ACTN|nr:hypothetical protein Cme02nite_32710 [Catellatospora methionotrophica]
MDRASSNADRCRSMTRNLSSRYSRITRDLQRVQVGGGVLANDIGSYAGEHLRGIDAAVGASSRLAMAVATASVGLTIAPTAMPPASPPR